LGGNAVPPSNPTAPPAPTQSIQRRAKKVALKERIIFYPNVKEHAPPLGGRTLRREKRFILRVMLLTGRLVAVAVARLVRLLLVALDCIENQGNTF